MLEYIRKNPPVSKCSSERGIHDDIIKKLNQRPDFINYLRQKRQKNIFVQKYLILRPKILSETNETDFMFSAWYGFWDTMPNWVDYAKCRAERGVYDDIIKI